MEYLKDWYPGYGEVETIRRMCPLAQDFLRDAVQEDPDFLQNYVLPTLQGYEDPEEKILSDLSDAVMAYELAEDGLGDLDGNLGNLGKSFFKKVGKAIKKVAKTVAKVTKKIALAPIKATERVAKFTVREAKKEIKATEKIGKKVGKVASNVWQKYGNIILTVAGAVLAPFTAGASLAAAALLTAGNTLYAKKRAAARAKQANDRNASAVAADAAAAEADTLRQVDAFYAQNQQWFITNLGVTPDKWAQLTLQQKIDLINAGAMGRPPAGTPVSDPSGAGQPSSGGGYSAPGGGYSPSGDGGGAGGSYMPGGGGGGQPGGPGQVQEAGMLGGAALPIIAAGVALAFVFGKPVKGGRTRRNPGRRRRRAVA